MANDRDCWQLICRGDAETFDRLYRENAPRLKAYLRHVVNSSEAAEDIVQDTFTQIWKKPAGFDPERGTLRTYLFGMGRKRAAEWWRRQRPDIPVEEEMDSKNSIETGSVVGDTFSRLPEEQRTLLWLREVEGQSYAELALILDVPVGTVRSRLFAAREALRQIWHDGDGRRKEEL